MDELFITRRSFVSSDELDYLLCSKMDAKSRCESDTFASKVHVAGLASHLQGASTS